MVDSSPGGAILLELTAEAAGNRQGGGEFQRPAECITTLIRPSRPYVRKRLAGPAAGGPCCRAPALAHSSAPVRKPQRARQEALTAPAAGVGEGMQGLDGDDPVEVDGGQQLPGCWQEGRGGVYVCDGLEKARRE